MKALRLLIFILAFSSCKKDQVVFEPSGFGQLTYFGFTLIDVGWDDPTDMISKTNYVDEVSSFTNIADILVVNANDQIVPRLQTMSDAEMQAILNIYFLLFEEIDSSAPSGHRYQLYPDYQTRWNQFVLTNDLTSHTDKIAALYIGEEPTWNGISATELTEACNYIKSNFPHTPIMIIEAYPAIDQLVIPSSADWIGFDQYFIQDPFTDTSYQANTQLLKSKMSSNQSLVIVMDSHHYQAGHGDQGGLSIDEMGEVANNYLEVAASESNVIALLGYFWPSGFDDPSAIGARGMSAEIQNEYRMIGKGITGK